MPLARRVAVPVLRSRKNGTDIFGTSSRDEGGEVAGDDGWADASLDADASTEALVSLVPGVGVHPATATTSASVRACS
jgi:hypothetical protein